MHDQICYINNMTLQSKNIVDNILIYIYIYIYIYIHILLKCEKITRELQIILNLLL
jgi:hypothetical protein